MILYAAYDPCAIDPCLNDGKCGGGLGSPQCDCDGTGFSGPTCNIGLSIQLRPDVIILI